MTADLHSQSPAQLREHISRLSCLCDISRCMDQDARPIDEVLEQVAARLPRALGDADRVLANIEWRGQSFGAIITRGCLCVPIPTAEYPPGTLSIGYQEPGSDVNARPLQAEEHDLIRDVAARLGAMMARRRALELAADRSAQLQAIVEQAPDAIELIDTQDMRFVEANAASHDTLGYTREEMLALHVWDIQEDMSREDVEQMAIQLKSQGNARFESRHRRKDGSLLDVRVSLRALRQGERDFVLAVWQDISAQKTAEARIGLLSMVVEQSPNAVIVTDLQARIIYVNQSFERITGYSRAEVLEQNPRLLQSGKTPADTYQSMWQTLASGNSWSGEFINRTRDGRERIEQATVVPLRDQQGHIRHYVGIKEDVTERKQLEAELEHYREDLEQIVQDRTEALAQKEERFRLLLESTSDGIFGIDLDGLITFANTAAVTLLGYEHGDQLVSLLAHEMAHHTHPDGEPYDMRDCHILRAMLDEQTISCDADWFWRRDGSSFPVAYSSAPMRIEGRIVGAVIAFQDISTRKQVEDELREAKTAAESANRAKSEFLANMSHEIRTPMNAILGLTHLLKRSGISAKQRAQLDKIDKAGQHLLQIINDILDLSKIEAGRLRLERADFDLSRIVDNAVQLIRDQAQAKGIEVIVDLRDVPVQLNGDGLRLEQILLNFLGNAVKFTDSGRISLTAARIQPGSDERLWVRFEVEDTGIGLSVPEQQHLFEPFVQADASTTRKFGGTGLGLVISRRLTDLMRGRIGVISELGQGSRFWIEVPFAPSKTALPPAQAVDLAGMRALVVADRAEDRSATAAILAGLGMNVAARPNGYEAIADLAIKERAGNPYEILLVEQNLPGFTGLELGRSLAAMGLIHPPRSLLMIDAGAAAPAPKTLAETAFVDILAKPLQPERLRELCQRLCSHPQRIQPRSQSEQDIEAVLHHRSPGARLLLAEDNAINREVALDLLTDVGFQVDLAEDGQQAVDKAKQTDYSLILMDIQMPIMDGLAATRMIRRSTRQPRVPIVAMTANAFEGDRDACLAAGMNDYISKPVDPETLYRALVHWLPAAAERAAQTAPSALEPKPPATSATNQTLKNPPQTEPDSQLLGQLRQIDGLDVDFGLLSVNNRLDRYSRVLSKLVHHREAAHLQQALLDSDAETARRAAHTLKGLSATIGANRIQTLARQLEIAFSAQPSGQPWPHVLVVQSEALVAEWNRFCQSLASSLPAATAAEHSRTAHPAFDPQEFETLGGELARLLATDDIQAVDFFDNHRILFTQAHPDLSTTLGRHLDRYEFAQALDVLERIIADRGRIQSFNPTAGHPR